MLLHLSTAHTWKPPFYLFVALLALQFGGCAKNPGHPAPRVIAVTMKKGDISPKQIRVRQNEPVQLAVSTLDVQHGFEIPELNVSEPINPGKPAEIAVDTSKKGTFEVECGIMCGAHHDDMRARLIVE